MTDPDEVNPSSWGRINIFALPVIGPVPRTQTTIFSKLY